MDLEQALGALEGKDGIGVRDYLKDLGIDGIRFNSNRCPLANYIHECLGTGPGDSVSVGPMDVTVYLEDGSEARYLLPSGAVEFVLMFDSGEL